MADLPPELLDLGRNVDNCDRHGGAWCSCKVRQFLSLLSEWMGDSLVDRTWTRWDRDEVVWGWNEYGHPLIGDSWVERDDLPDDPDDLPLFVLLTPRED